MYKMVFKCLQTFIMHLPPSSVLNLSTARSPKLIVFLADTLNSYMAPLSEKKSHDWVGCTLTTLQNLLRLQYRSINNAGQCIYIYLKSLSRMCAFPLWSRWRCSALQRGPTWPGTPPGFRGCSSDAAMWHGFVADPFGPLIPDWGSEVETGLKQ